MQIIVDICGRPPCEVVNWKTIFRRSITNCGLSTSLWGRELKVKDGVFRVDALGVDLLVRSWIERRTKTHKIPMTRMSTSLWGRELKEPVRCWPCRAVWVDLLVRSWIERSHPCTQKRGAFRRPPCEVVNWKPLYCVHLHCPRVDLLVRSWIESDLKTGTKGTSIKSTSLWGRELKEQQQ